MRQNRKITFTSPNLLGKLQHIVATYDAPKFCETNAYEAPPILYYYISVGKMTVLTYA